MNIMHTLSPSQDAVHNPLAINAAKQELSAIRSLDNFSKKILPVLTSILTVTLVATAGMFGINAVIAAGAAITAFEIGSAFLKNRADLNRELALYHKDIAKVLGKSPNEKLTLQDMRDAADEKKVGDKALKPLKAELDHLKYRARHNYINGIVHAGVTAIVTGLIGRSMGGVFDKIFGKEFAIEHLPQLLMYQIPSAIGASAAINAGIEKLTSSNFERNKPPTVYTDLVKMQEVSQVHNISPEQVFEVILKLDKNVAKEIEKTHGMAYQALTSRNKKRVVEKLEPVVHARQLAEHINEGASVTSIPLFVSGQLPLSDLSPLPATDAASNEPSLGENKSQSRIKGKHTARVVEQAMAAEANREAAEPSSPSIH